MSTTFGSNMRFDPRVLKNTAPLSPDVSQHLTRVYTALCAMLAAAATGAFANLTLPFFAGPASLLSTLVTLGLVFYLGASRTNQQTPTRIACALGLGFSMGLSTGPLISHVAEIDPALVLSAFLGTSAVFLCFSLAAYFGREQRMWIFLAGGLSSALTLLLVTSVLNIFLGSVALFQFQLYFGLLVFCAFVIYDTQLVIEKARLGDKDYIWHAVDLFIDFMAIFRRILIILARNNRDSKNKSQNRRR